MRTREGHGNRLVDVLGPIQKHRKETQSGLDYRGSSGTMKQRTVSRRFINMAHKQKIERELYTR